MGGTPPSFSAVHHTPLPKNRRSQRSRRRVSVMNPSYPGSSGDRHGPPSLSSSSNSGLGGKGGPPSQQQHSYHHSQPSLAQLTHGGHLHPLHGGSQQQQSHSMMHPGGPVLPPPPLPGSLGGGGPNTSRSPHPLSGSILHPPRGNMGGSSGAGGPPSVLGKPAGSQGPPPSSAAGMMGHSVRMQAPSLSQSMGSVQQSMVPSSGGLKPPSQGYNVRPQSPPRRQPEPQQQQQQQVQIQQQYGLDGRIIPNDQMDGDYYQQQQTMLEPPPRHRELRVEDALLYLDQVKQQFGDQPDIYNQFLDVMKDFKAQAIDTPGVILRVSTLFRGYPNLILGFNTFLPPGYRIRPDTSIEVIPSQMAGRGGVQQSMYSGVGAQQSSNANMGHRPPPVTIPPPPYSPPELHKPTPSSRQQMAPTGQMKVGGKPKKQQMPTPSGGNATSRSSTNPVEFDHAIHYVTTIKQRFADEPETYKEFLAILHTYQKEQRSIRQVLDQVSHLFRDHPDLLREFTFFLPDAVQEQAKERLNRAAEKAQQRKDQMALKARKFGSQGGYQHSDRRDDRGGDSPSSAAMKGRMMDDEDAYMKYGKKGRGYKDDDVRLSGKALERREKERERERNRSQFNHKRTKRRPYDGKERRAYLAISDVLLDKEEWNIFEKIKKILPSRDNWREFLKCLELYSQEVLDRNEMLSLIRNLFGRHTDLVEEFDHLLCSHGVQKSPKEIWPFIPLAETDLSQCRRATPSYRGLPASYPIPPCSHRSALEKHVCNDSWVSVPTGSEDYSFKSMRKNQYEEALFKCEDERFEIDMVIEANASTISILEPLAHEIEVLNSKKSNGEDDKLWNYVVDKGTFRVTHLNAITRIYGDSGTHILDLLRKYPAGAIPVILKRLKQKDQEWRRAREDLNRQWKEVNEKNYHKSLDHSSFYFKQKDKKQTSMKMMMQEAKKKLEADEKRAEESKTESVASPSTVSATAAVVSAKAPPQASDIADALKKEQATTAASSTSGGKVVTPSLPPPSSSKWKPHFVYKLASVQIHKEAFGLLSYAAEKNLSVADKEKVSKVWQAFFFPFFHLEEEWLVRKPQRTIVTREKARTLHMGADVSTDFGEGTVEEFNRVKGYFSINLAGIGCQAYLQPSAVTTQEASAFPPGLPALDSKQDAAKVQADYKSRFYGNQHAYAFLRLYQMLHNRLERAFDLCEKAKRNRNRRTINPAARALAHAHHSLSASTKEKTGDYQAFLSKLYSLIDGSVDSSKYEDSCRSLMGSTSYFLFTMDKLVTQVLKQMQHLANDDTCQELTKAFMEQQGEPKPSSDPTGAEAKFTAYLNKTKSIFEGEGAFRIEFNPGVLRKTPLEARGGMTPSGSAEPFKIWAPSPRVKAPESSKWLFEPELAIEYLGSMDDDGDDDDDDDESPSATPVDTPSATPMYGSPVQDTPLHDSQDDEDDMMEESKDDEVKKESATPVSSGSIEPSDSGSISSDDAHADNAAKFFESATLLKKRTRSPSADRSAVSERPPSSSLKRVDTLTAAKKARTVADVKAVTEKTITTQENDPMTGRSETRTVVSFTNPKTQVMTQGVNVETLQQQNHQREEAKEVQSRSMDNSSEQQSALFAAANSERLSANAAATSSTVPVGDTKSGLSDFAPASMKSADMMKD